MAGLIRKGDIEVVHNAVRIDEIISEHVMLQPAGIGSLKGLCPLHGKYTPFFNTYPHLGMFHYLGYGESSDVIFFMQKVDHLPFMEAVEMLTAEAGITLHHEGGGTHARTEEPDKHQRLLDIYRITGKFYQQQLAFPEAYKSHTFLAERGSTQAMCAHLGIGHTPASWDSLTHHSRSKGLTDQETQIPGLGSQGSRGVCDRLRGHLIWPIRDATGATIGFGTRRLDGSDKESPKYPNTPETPIYKKSQLLYGLDLAKKTIATEHEVIIVEGYTDVMATHVADVTNAVAACGTAFGSEYAKIIHRLLGGHAGPATGVLLSTGRVYGSEVVFTFDGDDVGQKAALHAHGEDQNFVTQTLAAVAPGGQNPCDLCLSQGNRAIVDLMNSRIPLFEFVVHSVLSRMDLCNAEGHVQSLWTPAGIVAHIKDHALRVEYTRQLVGWLGMDIPMVEQAIRAVGYIEVLSHEARPGGTEMVDADRPVLVSERRGPEDPVSRIERRALEAVLQHLFYAVNPGFEKLGRQSPTVPMHRTVHDAIHAVDGLDAFAQTMCQAEVHFGLSESAVLAASRRFVQAVLETAGEFIDPAITQPAIAPLSVVGEADVRSYYRGVVVAMMHMDLTHKLGEIRTVLLRLNENDPAYSEMFRELMRLEQRRQNYTERSQPVTEVESLTLDHIAVRASYVCLINVEAGPRGDQISNFDVRLFRPNAGRIPTSGLHTIERLLASLLRDRIDSIIDCPPLGCRIGFHSITWGIPSVHKVTQALASFLHAIAEDVTWEDVSGTDAFSCGNYCDYSLFSAREQSRTILGQDFSLDPLERIHLVH